jgi:hypothetical protein
MTFKCNPLLGIHYSQGGTCECGQNKTINYGLSNLPNMVRGSAGPYPPYTTVNNPLGQGYIIPNQQSPVSKCTETSHFYYLGALTCACGKQSFGQRQESKPSKSLIPPTSERVNHPDHYKKGGIEVIDIIEAYNLNFRLANVVKYVLRCNYKSNSIEDLEKAEWYLKRDIEKRKASTT